MTCSNFQYSNHAVMQMFKRNISADEVEGAISSGEVIKNYPNDKPYPSCLILYFVNNRPIHVVVSQDAESSTCFVVTAYQPTPNIWSVDFKTKI